MGAWGYGPHDNDTAADFVGSRRDTYRHEILAVFQGRPRKLMDRSYHHNEVRAAADELLHFVARDQREYAGEDEWLDIYVREPLGEAREALVHALEDHEYVTMWKNPEALRKSIRAQIKSIDQALAKTK